MTSGIEDTIEIVASAGGSMEPTLDAVAHAFHAASGHTVKITYRHDFDEPDVVIMTKDALERRSGFVGAVEDNPISIGRNSTGLGAAIRLGAPIPDISSVEAFKKSLLDTDRILLTDGHNSSLHLQSILKEMGLYERLEQKIERAAIAQSLLDRLVSGAGAEIMILSINAMRACNDKRLVIVGPLPDALQNYVEFFAVPRRDSPKKEVAWAFARFCAGPARHLLAANGIK